MVSLSCLQLTAPSHHICQLTCVYPETLRPVNNQHVVDTSMVLRLGQGSKNDSRLYYKVCLFLKPTLDICIISTNWSCWVFYGCHLQVNVMVFSVGADVGTNVHCLPAPLNINLHAFATRADSLSISISLSLFFSPELSHMEDSKLRNVFLLF